MVATYRDKGGWEEEHGQKGDGLHLLAVLQRNLCIYTRESGIHAS